MMHPSGAALAAPLAAMFAMLLRGSAAATTASGALLKISPTQKVIMLLSELEAKLKKDGEDEEKAFDEYEDWCNNAEKDKGFEIKTAKTSIEGLTASIDKAVSDITTLGSKVDDLTSAISTNEADLKAATALREKEGAEFLAAEQELKDTIDTISRAINILERKLHGSALLQQQMDLRNINKLIQALGAVVDAAAMTLKDKQKLVGLVQSGEDDSDDAGAGDFGAPDPEAYKAKSGTIIDVLEDLKQKATEELAEATSQETNARHNFELLKQSLEDQIKQDNKAVTDAKQMSAEAQEAKAIANGELEATKKVLADAQEVLKNLDSDCATKKADHEESVKNRAEELKALAEAKKVLMEMAGSASSQVYGDSFLQLDSVADSDSFGASHLHTGADLAGFEVVNLIRQLARKEKSAGLAQLAGRVSAAMQSGDDPFTKVKQLISDMIQRLMKEAGEDAQHKAYCDKEMGDTKQKMDALKYDIEKYSSKIDKKKSQSANLKDDVTQLQADLAEIAKEQSEADAIRMKEHKTYVQVKTDLEQGIKGIRMALKVLRDYYAAKDDDSASAASLLQGKKRQPDAPTSHSKASGAGGGIIAMLEVVESDFTKSLATTEMNEDTAETQYQKLSMENKVSRTTKAKDVEYKTKEAAALDKSVLELSSDLESAQTELDAVLKYSAQIRAMCEAKPESFEERKVRREAEIAGLKQALQILEGEAVFAQVQGHSHHRAAVLRGLSMKH